MNEKTNTPQKQAPSQNSGQRRNNNNRRRNNSANKGPNAQAPQNAQPQRSAPPQQAQASGQNPNQAKRRNNKRPRGPARTQEQGPQSLIDKLYEKYLNLLDQHLVARRKYHDLFFRADPNQKLKLEKNFYSTINDVRDFESKMSPDVQVLFEKRNNGLAADRTYTSNHALPIEGDEVCENLEIIDPHLLQTQIKSDFKDDSEESSGSLEDYLKYKGL